MSENLKTIRELADDLGVSNQVWDTFYNVELDSVHYAGFLPDFVLYLANESYVYQIYIESM